MATAKILLVDDDHEFAIALSNYFSPYKTLKVVKICTNAKDALHWLNNGHTCDVILSDIRMPDIDGIEFQRKLSLIKPTPIFVAMTSFDSDQIMLQILSSGAMGYILKTDPPRSIVASTLKALTPGATALSPTCTTRLVRQITDSRAKTPPSRRSFPKISAIEERVLRLIQEGKTNAEIAQELSYAEVTIKKKVSRLFKAFGVNNRYSLITSTRCN